MEIKLNKVVYVGGNRVAPGVRELPRSLALSLITRGAATAVNPRAAGTITAAGNGKDADEFTEEELEELRRMEEEEEG